MALLRERGLDEALRALQVPLLGICLGMQLLFEASEEGDVACLGLLPGRVRKLVRRRGIARSAHGLECARADVRGDRCWTASRRARRPISCTAMRRR